MPNKTIEFEYAGVDYTLEYTRATVRKMENDGIVMADLGRRPMSLLPKIFAYGFNEHHRGVKSSLVAEIFENMGDKEELFEEIADMIAETYDSLMSVKDEKNVIKWKKNF